VLEHEDLARTPILVLANKQDLPDAMGVEELTRALDLHAIRNHDWHIQACCALNGQGLLEALSWIYQRTRPGGQAGAAG
jgi:ADP-ribosylation factor-like protein 5B